MKSIQVILISIVCVVSGCEVQVKFKDDTHTSSPPDGWKIICDGQGHYGTVLPPDNLWTNGYTNLSVWGSRKDAIEYTWYRHNHTDLMPEPQHGPWHICNGGQEK